MNKLRSFFLFLVALCFSFVSGTVFAEEAVSQAKSVVFVQNMTLWSVWKSLPSNERMPWEKYWKESSRLSGIPHTKEAWRKVRAGTVVATPRSTFAVIAEDAEKTHQEVLEREAVMREIQIHLAETKYIEEIEDLKKKLFASVALLVITLFVLLVLLIVSKRKAPNGESMERKRETVDESSSPKPKYEHPKTRMPGLPASHAEAEAMRIAAGVPSTKELTTSNEGEVQMSSFALQPSDDVAKEKMPRGFAT